MRKTRLFAPIAACLSLLVALSACAPQALPPLPSDVIIPEPTAGFAAPTSPEPSSPAVPAFAVNPDGGTIETRFPAPDGFVRTDEENDSFGAFLRAQKLLPDGSPVLLYDGTEKGGNVAAAVLAIDVGKRDLQQCADAAMRLRAEYLFAQGRYADIAFHLTNGFALPYEKFRAGYRLKVSGNDTTLVKSKEPDSSYEVFRAYCDTLFTYAGTLSLSRECPEAADDDLRIGDLFLQGGSPGHCVIVVDRCENPQTGDVAFLLAQSYMPAQQIHVLKNPNCDDPWYYLSELSYPFDTPQWTFDAGSHRRFPE